jgi:hypothetical protein
MVTVRIGLNIRSLDSFVMGNTTVISSLYNVYHAIACKILDLETPGAGPKTLRSLSLYLSCTMLDVLAAGGSRGT